jgi:hypothetical protein
MNTTNINEQVEITVMGFKKDMVAYPRRMEYQGSTYEFIDAGLRCLVRHGNRIAEVLTLTDGAASYRLRSDNKGGLWTLLSISA